ncbi:Hypothetical predicted protein [Olea europaea subsp. europaea]|uniref:Uncharacterized protein n=1 Tax=Olea europaea subsp. europaea TaxID=158383 RepID=A0A8S0TG48_OLEEU|nr:Hypothetical predicted protein [Olea europaea subsp. europaea]
MGRMRSMLFPNFGSIFSTADLHVKNEDWDEESLHREGEAVSSMGIGGGWQLAWKWSKREGANVPVDGEYIQVVALVYQSALYSEKLMDQHPVGPALVHEHPSETASKGHSWTALLEPGIGSALIVRIGIQILQQIESI